MFSKKKGELVTVGCLGVVRIVNYNEDNWKLEISIFAKEK